MAILVCISIGASLYLVLYHLYSFLIGTSHIDGVLRGVCQT